MNERIKILAEQAGYHSDVFEMCKPGMEKFAELIVKECGKVYIQNQQDGVMTLTQDLLQHFGVEE